MMGIYCATNERKQTKDIFYSLAGRLQEYLKSSLKRLDGLAVGYGLHVRHSALHV